MKKACAWPGRMKTQIDESWPGPAGCLAEAVASRDAGVERCYGDDVQGCTSVAGARDGVSDRINSVPQQSTRSGQTDTT